MKDIPQDLIITIGRQCGAGGRAIGRILASRFSLPYFDNEILALAAGKYGYAKAIFDRADEKRPSKFRLGLGNMLGVSDMYVGNPMSPEAIYKGQSDVIRQLADEGGGVFVGRSSDYILRHKPHLVSVFLHAPLEQRASELVKRKEVSTLAEGLQRAGELDRRRHDFYNYYTNGRWGHADNYHLSFNALTIGPEAAADILEAYIRARFGI